MADSELSDPPPPASEEELIRIPNAQFISDVGAFLAGGPFHPLLKGLYTWLRKILCYEMPKECCADQHSFRIVTDVGRCRSHSRRSNQRARRELQELQAD